MTNTEEQQLKEDDTISLLDLVSVIAKRWKFIFFTSLTVAVLIFAYSIYTLNASPDSRFNKLPNIYKPEVKVMLQESGGNSISNMLQGSDLGILAGLAGKSTGSSSAELAQALLKGKTLVDTLSVEFDFIDRYEIEKYPKTTARNMIIEAMETDFDSSTGILAITYKDIDKEFATAVLNRALVLLEDRFKELTMQQLINKKLFLEEQLKQASTDLKKAQDILVEFQKKNGVVNIDIQSEQQIIEISELNSEIIAQEIELNSLLEYLRKDDPKVVRLQTTIEQLRKELEIKKRGFSNFSTDYIPQNQLPELAAIYVNLKSELNIQTEIYIMLRSQYEKTKIEETDNSKTFQIIEYAEVPEVKESPSRGKICIIVTIAIFFLTIFIAFIMEYFEKVKKDPIEAQKLNAIKKVFKKVPGK